MNRFLNICLLLLMGSYATSGQTEGFSYQGIMRDGANPANANYDFEFRLFTAEVGGSHVITQRQTVAVVNGLFTAKLDLGVAFTGPDRWLEIGVKPAGSGTYQTLSPRRQVLSAPYAIRSFVAATAETAANATQLGGIASGGFIQNTTTQQPLASFNISGSGVVAGGFTAGGIATPSISLGGTMVVHSAGNIQITTGPRTGIFREESVKFQDVGQTNVSTGVTTEATNQLINIGANSGREGTFNSGVDGFWLRLDSRPAFAGVHIFKKANGSGTESELLTITPSGDLGIGTNAPESKLHVSGANEILSTGAGAGIKFRDRASASSNDDWNWYSTGNIARFWRAGVGDLIAVTPSGNVGIGNPNPNDRLNVNGNVSLLLSTGGSTNVCQTSATFRLATCSSSIRYKRDIDPFTPGLDLIRRLRPVAFNWIESGMRDMGLVAEDVAKLEPLLVTRNEKGEVEGVKYDRVGVVLINVVKQQQAEIDQLRQKVTKQEDRLDSLIKVLCSMNANAAVCPKE